MCKPASLSPGYDFIYYWVLGRANSEHINPYAWDSALPLLNEACWPSNEGYINVTPPWTIWLIKPFSLLEFEYGRITWLIFLALLLIVTIFLLTKKLDIGANLSKTTLLYSLLSFSPLISSSYSGNHNIVVLLAVVIFIYLLKNEEVFKAGAVLSLCLLKPQLFIVFFSTLPIILWKGTLRLIAGLTCGLLLQFCISWSIFSDSYQFYFKSPALLKSALNFSGASLSQVIYEATDTSWQIPILLTGIMLSCYLVFHSKNKQATLVEIILPISLMSSPYTWGHSYIILLPTFLIFSEQLFDLNRVLAKWVLLILNGLILIPYIFIHVDYTAVLLPIVLVCFFLISSSNPLLSCHNAKISEKL